MDARQPRMRATARALYTSSTLALESGHGKLAWYYQHVPGESLDLDEVFERVLVDIGGQKLVFTIGKTGHPVEAGPHDRQVSGLQGDGFSERLRLASIRRPASRTYRSDILEQQSGNGCRRVPAPRAGTTGRP